MVFLQLLSISITLLRIVNVRLERAGERIWERKLRSNKVIELRVEPQKREQKREPQRFLFEALSY